VDLRTFIEKSVDSSRDTSKGDENSVTEGNKNSSRKYDLAQKKRKTENKQEKNVHYLDLPMEKLTPGMRQFVAIKKKHLDCVILFRMGDFYETFYDDAVTVARDLEIVLTARGSGEKRAPLAGIPYHALEAHLAKLVKKGHKVAIVEQLEDPKKAKGLVKRGVVRIVTPGMIMEQSMLDSSTNNYVMALTVYGDDCAFGFCDISTGEFLTGLSNVGELGNHLVRFAPAECIVPMSLGVNTDVLTLLKNHNVFVNHVDDRSFRTDNASRQLNNHFKVHSVDGFGVQGLMVNAAGALLGYISETQKTNLDYINIIHVLQLHEHMTLDASTLRNLELLKNSRDGSAKGALFSVLDKTKTAMGSRLLRKWIKEPLRKVEIIEKRLDAVDWLKKKTIVRNDMIELLAKISDVERLISRVAYGSSNARDLLSLKKSLEQVPGLKKLLIECNGLLSTVGKMNNCDDIISLIKKSIVDDPPLSVREGNMIKRGYHVELDKLWDIKKNGKKVIAHVEEIEREATGIKNLKVKFNNVFGYFIEVNKSQLSKVPDYYVRKQTTANAERYIMPKLKVQEDLILNAEEKIVTLEYDLFKDILLQLSQQVIVVQEVAHHIGMLDVFCSFAVCAAQYNYTKPIVDESGFLDLQGARHPVLEQIEDVFVPNDVLIAESEMMIITGPNMAGKSSFMRTVALCVLMTQIGCFVPAESARISVVDRIFTRVGASDDLSAGQSTFMVEMNETAAILHNATSRSLIILDEIGRGTSTFDGVSIAWSVAEYIAHDVRAKTLFATHYHIMNKLAENHKNIFNYNVVVKEDGDEIIFLHKIVPGSTDKSYGIHVAKLAGMPASVIARAEDVQKKLEEEDKMVSKIHE
jgi:DNA mismatch repair protein MutS